MTLQDKFKQEPKFTQAFIKDNSILEHLNEVLKTNIRKPAIEYKTNEYAEKRIDVICKMDEGEVLIENQYGEADFDHFGKVVGHLYQKSNYKYVIWIAESFNDIFFRNAVTGFNRDRKDKKIILVKASILKINNENKVIFNVENPKDLYQYSNITKAINSVSSGTSKMLIEYVVANLKNDKDILDVYTDFGKNKINHNHYEHRLTNNICVGIKFPGGIPKSWLIINNKHHLNKKANIIYEELKSIPDVEVNLQNKDNYKAIEIKRHNSFENKEDNIVFAKNVLLKINEIVSKYI